MPLTATCGQIQICHPCRVAREAAVKHNPYHCNKALTRAASRAGLQGVKPATSFRTARGVCLQKWPAGCQKSAC